MEYYKEYIKGGEILIAPSSDFEDLYLLKCSVCDELYNQFEKFFSHHLTHYDHDEKGEPSSPSGALHELFVDIDENFDGNEDSIDDATTMYDDLVKDEGTLHQVKIEADNLGIQETSIQKSLNVQKAVKITNDHRVQCQGNHQNPENYASDNNTNNIQLFGRDFDDEEMIPLPNNVYCRKKIFDMAMDCSSKPSHVARRLIEGVFKIDTLLKCTLTGNSPKCQGRERQMATYECLDRRAKHTIIDFSIECGVKRGWKGQKKSEICRAMSQRIGEIKRLYKRLN